MIFTLGEAVYDIIFKHNEPVASVHGGSMYNVAVSLGRAGKKVAFTGFYADDRIGNQSVEFLKQNGVNVDSFLPVEGVKSNLALAFLNAELIPQYEFYRDEQLNGHAYKVDISSAKYLITGSFYAIDDRNFKHVYNLVEIAKQNNVPIIYDPNIRGKHLNQKQQRYERIAKLMERADLVKLSTEDLYHITGKNSLNEWMIYLDSNNVEHFILTDGASPVRARFRGEELVVEVPQVDVVSSVGGGDGFTAGFAARGPGAMENLTEFRKAIEQGIAFAGQVCTSNENYISKDLQTEI